MSSRFNPTKIYFGGDYNPDQWPEELWEEDVRLFRLASVNLVTLPVFSWAKLQPSEEQYEFDWLDRVLDLLANNGISACLATPTAAQPAWMSRAYPDVLPVDVEGRKRTHGKRVNFCPNSPSYRKFSVAIASEMARRYAHHPSLAIWHVSNEYGTYCFCDNCAAAFRRWLEKRYETVERLNERWNLSFWGHTVYDWKEVSVPSELNDDDKWYQPKMLDYLRFMTDSSMECFGAERDAIRAESPDVPITTNISGFIKKLDQSRFCAEQDVAAWDNYPSPADDPATTALKHDIVRGLRGGSSFLLMEQSPSQQNWQPYNVLKRPGEVRLLSYQALAHGADSVLFFQMRRSIGGVEKLHGAFIEHAGHENTRVFRECAELGRELAALGDAFLGARTIARAAILFDWDNWWAVELSSGPSKDLDYFDQVRTYYTALHRMNVAVDVVRPEADLSQYSIVIAPTLYMVKEGVAENLESFVEEGGTLVATFFSGIVDENDLVVTGGYPGRLRALLGVWVEETDALLPSTTNRITISEASGPLTGSYPASLLCDLLHAESARVLAVYGEDFYAGMPCLTVNDFGKGRAYYVATDGGAGFVDHLLTVICEECGVAPELLTPPGVEVARRTKEGADFFFLLNHSDHAQSIALPTPMRNLLQLSTGEVETGGEGTQLSLPPQGVAILTRA